MNQDFGGILETPSRGKPSSVCSRGVDVIVREGRISRKRLASFYSPAYGLTSFGVDQRTRPTKALQAMTEKNDKKPTLPTKGVLMLG